MAQTKKKERDTHNHQEHNATNIPDTTATPNRAQNKLCQRKTGLNATILHEHGLTKKADAPPLHKIRGTQHHSKDGYGNTTPKEDEESSTIPEKEEKKRSTADKEKMESSTTPKRRERAAIPTKKKK